jgi:hypothetical protein
MEHYAGIDVSLELSSVCVVDTQGKIVKEAKLASAPEGSSSPSSASAVLAARVIRRHNDPPSG